MAALFPRLSCKPFVDPTLPVQVQLDYAEHCLQYAPPPEKNSKPDGCVQNLACKICDITLRRLDYGDSICDGFYEPLGDFPEIVEKGNFPTLGQLRHVQSFEQDSREVGTA
jgi:hypothetical protein